MKLLDKNNIDYIISLGSKPVNYKIRLFRSVKESGCIEIKTDKYWFGFINNDLRYIICCDSNHDIKLVDSENIKTNIYDLFNIISMCGNIVFDRCKERFNCDIYDKELNENDIIIIVANLEDNWYISFEFGCYD